VTAPGDRPRVLVVDDEDNIRFLLDSALTHFGFDVVSCAGGTEALESVAVFRPDLIVLDVMMPDVDGFVVLKRLRAMRDRTPVLFLTARDAPEDAVRGLTLGADDYVKKPFSLEEVVARIRALLRRVSGDKASGLMRFRDLEIDDDAHQVRRGGVVIDLSPTEYKLLHYFVANAGRVLSKPQILDHVWNYDWGGEATVVETYVSYLRKKLDPHGPSLLHTVRGIGYVLRSEV
jgi:two-component system, OmpR family, response regulator